MADLIDVQNTLLNLVAGTLFSEGYQNGAATVSLLGPTVRLYAGWPNAAELDPDLKTGTAHVTVFVDSGGRLTTRYEKRWVNSAPVTPTFTATVDGYAVTFAGAVSASQSAGIQLGNNAPAGYRLLANDTPSTVAAALAALLPWASPTVSGATITFPASVISVAAKTGADQTASCEVRRQEQVFRITVWAPTPAIRQTISTAVDALMASTRRLCFSDNSVSNIPLYRGTFVDDVPQTKHEWRRDLRYAIEYPTILTQTFPVVLFPYANINGNAANQVLNNPTVPQYSYNFLTEDGTGILTGADGNQIVVEVAPNT